MHTSLRNWVVCATNGYVVGYISSYHPCFHLNVVVGEPRGLYLADGKYHYITQTELFSFIHNFSCHRICHLVHEMNCGVLYVYTIGLGGFHH
jgi:hypothetical protein